MNIGTTRVEAFSDGVIAIIITIMVLELKLPNINEDANATKILYHIGNLLPYFIAYVFSFMMIGIFWTNHHHMFHLLEKSNEPLLGINLLFLFFMSLIPFATGIMGAAPFYSISTALYGLVMLLTTLTLSLMRAYTIKKGLIHKDADPNLSKQIKTVSNQGKTKGYIGAAAYLLSIPLGFISVYLAYFCFIIPPILFFIPHGIDDETLAAKVARKN